MTKKTKILALTMLVVLAITIWAVVHYNVFTNTKVTKQTSSSKQAPKKSNTQTSQPTQTKTTPTTPSSGSSSNNQSTLITPYGNFVSDHTPNLGGSPHPNLMSSVCTTTPGAHCQISFTNGSITKYLASQAVDSKGSTYWTWYLQDIGLSTGDWTIKATATLNSQTETAVDPLVLKVSP